MDPATLSLGLALAARLLDEFERGSPAPIPDEVLEARTALRKAQLRLAESLARPADAERDTAPTPD